MSCHLQSTKDCASKLTVPVQWRKQYAAFSKTSAGQAVLVAALVLLCYTGLIFKLLNLLFILWWFAPLIILPLLSVAGRKVISSYIDSPSRQPHAQGAEIVQSQRHMQATEKFPSTVSRLGIQAPCRQKRR